MNATLINTADLPTRTPFRKRKQHRRRSKELEGYIRVRLLSYQNRRYWEDERHIKVAIEDPNGSFVIPRSLARDVYGRRNSQSDFPDIPWQINYRDHFSVRWCWTGPRPDFIKRFKP